MLQGFFPPRGPTSWLRWWNFPPLGSIWEPNSIVGIFLSRKINPIVRISPTQRQKFASTAVRPIPTQNYMTSQYPTPRSQNKQKDIPFQMKIMVKQIKQDPNNISILKINACITKLFDIFIQIHTWLHLTKLIQDLSLICVCFLKGNTDNSHLLI